MTTTAYSNSFSNDVTGNGGSVLVTIAAGVGRGNSGTSLSCRECFIRQGIQNAGTVRLNLSSACTSTTGIALPKGITYIAPYRVKIDDVSKLYFSGTNDDKIYILYRK